MSFRRFITQSFIIFMFLLLGSVAIGHVQFTLPFVTTDSLQRGDTIYFGIHPQATYCIDSQLGEFEIAPVPECEPFMHAYALFKDIRTAEGACMGKGIFTDLRNSYSPTQADTFKVGFCVTVFPGSLSWSKELSLYFDSAKFILDSRTINMFAQDSVVINNPDIFTAKIFTWGPKSPNAVGEFWNEQPMRFSIEQNYPNPFNPVTVISYQLKVKSAVSLKVYDVLGREVATLVDEIQESGFKSVTWDATEFSSGVYYYKLLTDYYSETKKLLYIR
ncbi:MAG: T9SS type A sorting domain-containing protein [Ignavibacteriae bacterium]|nr:T9SS type A sorting domain-containing protein [Ignavibacteriota bacterium]